VQDACYLHVCVSVHMSACLCVYTYVHVYVYVYMSACLCVCTYVCMSVRIFNMPVCQHICVCVSVHLSLCMCVSTSVSVCLYICLYVCAVSKLQEGRTPLHFAAYDGHEKVVSLLLKEGRTDVLAVDKVCDFFFQVYVSVLAGSESEQTRM
jgi:hypothetical protein